MKTYPLSKAPEIFSNGNSTGHLIAAMKQHDIVLLHLASADRIPPHTLDVHVTFLVAEGSAILTADKKSVELFAGDAAESAAGELREWGNPNAASCRMFVIKQK